MLRKLYLITAAVPAIAILCIASIKESIKYRPRATLSHKEHVKKECEQLIHRKGSGDNIRETDCENPEV